MNNEMTIQLNDCGWLNRFCKDGCDNVYSLDVSHDGKNYSVEVIADKNLLLLEVYSTENDTHTLTKSITLKSESDDLVGRFLAAMFNGFI